MKTRRVTRYLCEHCNHGHWTAADAKNHERTCFHAPLRDCDTCHIVGHQVGQDLALWNEETDTTGRDWVNLVLLNHGGCAKCTLAAVLQMGKREKMTHYGSREEEGMDSWGFNYRQAHSQFKLAPGIQVDEPAPF